MSSSIVVLFVSFLPFAVSTSFTPGPNNLMLANSGARFGFVRSIPLQAGVVAGFALLNLFVGAGVGGLIAVLPAALKVMRIIGVLYFLYLAWRIATAEQVKAGETTTRPLTFLQATALQWINPKAWIMAVGAMTTYTTLAYDLRLQVLIITLVFAVVGVASTSAWSVFGQMIRRYLTTPRKRTAFNWSMAALLLLSIIPIVTERL